VDGGGVKPARLLLVVDPVPWLLSVSCNPKPAAAAAAAAAARRESESCEVSTVPPPKCHLTLSRLRPAS
jgi:hypothetical protein